MVALIQHVQNPTDRQNQAPAARNVARDVVSVPTARSNRSGTRGDRPRGQSLSAGTIRRPNAPVRSSHRTRRTDRAGFRALLVRPRGNFAPDDWRERPQFFEIVQDAGVIPFRGMRDAWLFHHNKRALESGNLELWAICLPQRTDSRTDSVPA